MGLLLAGAFATVVLAYLFTEYLLKRFDVRRRDSVGDHYGSDRSPLLPIFYANGVSLLVVSMSCAVMLFAADVSLYIYALLFCLCAQIASLGQHLWFYYRDHPRLGY